MSEQHDKFCTTYELGFCECDDIAAVRADEREEAAQRVERAWAAWDDYQTIGCQQCYTKEAFDTAADAARGEDMK